MEEENRTPNVTRSFKVSGMPMGQWLEWEKSAVEEYADCYWLKIISDHKKSKEYDVVINMLLRRIEELEEKIDQVLVTGQENEKESPIRTLGK